MRGRTGRSPERANRNLVRWLDLERDALCVLVDLRGERPAVVWALRQLAADLESKRVPSREAAGRH